MRVLLILSLALSGGRLVAEAASFAEGRLVTAAGVEIFWRASGNGPAVIVPGGFLFDGALDGLAATHRLILYDMRNRGRSSPVRDPRLLTIEGDLHDLEAIRSHFGVERFSAIGYSYLGKLVVLYALRHPERVSRLVQIAPAAMRSASQMPPVWDNTGEVVTDAEAVARLGRLRAAGAHRERPAEYCEQEWLATRVQLVGNRDRAEQLRSRCDLPNEWPAALAVHVQHHVASTRSADVGPLDVARFRQPVLTIHGTRDRDAPYGGGREWAATLPNARLRKLEGAAHAAWIDEPSVLDDVATFLSGEWPDAAEEIAMAAEVPLSQLRGAELLERVRRAHRSGAAALAGETLSLRLEGNVFPRSQSRSPRPPFDPFPVEVEVLFRSAGAEVVVDENFHWPGFVAKSRAVSRPDRSFLVNLDTNRIIDPALPRTVWVDQLVRVPSLLSHHALAEPGSVRFLGVVDVSDADAYQLVAARVESERVTIGIDRNDRVRRVIRLVSDVLTGDALEVLELSGDVIAGASILPRTIRRFFDGRLHSELVVSSGAAPDLARFEAPAGITDEQPGSTPLTVESIAPGVWLVRNIGGADYQSLVVVHDDGLVLLETPFSEAAMERVLERLRSDFPGIRIKAAMVTHHHFDHSGGVRAVMAEGAEIYVPRGTEELFRSIAAAPRTLQKDAKRIEAQALRIQSVESAVITPANEGPAIHLYDVGENDHADGFLFAWIPDRKLVFQGDLYVKRGDDPEPARRQGVTFLTRIRELGLAPERIIGVHGRIATIGDLEQSVRGTARASTTPALRPRRQQDPDPLDDFGEPERFREKAVRTLIQRGRGLRAIRGEHEDRHRMRRPDLLQLCHHLEPVHVRHLQVEQDQVVFVLQVQAGDLARLGGRHHFRVTGAAERVLEQPHVRRLIVDDQDPWHRHFSRQEHL